MPSNWEFVVNTTIPKYVKGEEDLTMRRRRIFAALQKRGRTTFNHSGSYIDWKSRIIQTNMRGYEDMGALNYARLNRHVTHQLDWRGYESTEAYSEMDKLKNRNNEAIVKAVMDKAKMMMDDIKEKFGDKVYVDGTASPTDWHGVESFFNVNSTSTKRPVGVPDDSYAGCNTDVADKGGEWSNTGSTVHAMGDWPHGDGDTNFDYWSPVVVDYTSALTTNTTTGVWGFSNATATWQARCLEALRFGILASQRNDTDGAIDLITMDQQMFLDVKQKLQAEEQITVSKGQTGEMYELGFKNDINWDGVDLAWEYAVDSGLAYGWNFDCMEIMSMYDTIFHAKPVVFDENQAAYKLLLLVFGNFKFKSPKFFTKWKAIS
jgi:hypothetical protein